MQTKVLEEYMALLVIQMQAMHHRRERLIRMDQTLSQQEERLERSYEANKSQTENATVLIQQEYDRLRQHVASLIAS
jgi:hypothetical protein